MVDVTVIPDEEIMGHRSMAALMLLQKHIHRRDLSGLLDNLAQRVPQHEDQLMTIAQQLEQKGIEKGRQEGRQEAKLEVARILAQNGFDHNSIIKLTGLTADDLTLLDH